MATTQKQHHACAAFDALAAARRRFGQARLELGVFLEHIHRTEAWSLRNESFAAFLEEERINQSAAYQYMRVARRFVVELGLDDNVLAELAQVNMRTLDLAARVVTPDTIEEVLAIITVLGERDARIELEALESEQDVKPSGRRREPQLARVMRLYRELPDDQRIDLRNALRIREQAPNERHPG